MNSFHVRELGSDQVDHHATTFANLYRRIYAESPYCEGEQHVGAFIERFAAEVMAPGFQVVVAEVSGQIVGFAHGITFGPNAWWDDADCQPPEVRGVSKFAVMEFMVRRQERGRGIGTALMTTLLGLRVEPYATLCANRMAPARQIYRRWGWNPVARAHPPGIGEMDVLLLRLSNPDMTESCGQ